MNPSKYIAEFIGTLTLALVISLSLESGFLIITPLAAGLTLGLFAYTIGGISGCHINPAITVGLMINKKINPKEGLGYIIAQLLAGITVSLVLKTGGAPSLETLNMLEFGLAELIGSFFFGWGVAAVVWGKVTQSASGLVVGGSLFLGILIAGATGSAGILNPAVALSLGTFNLAYFFGPLIGVTLGMLVYGWITEK